MIAPIIAMPNGGRFISGHEGATVYYDLRHKVLKVPVEGDVVLALLVERQSDGSYRNQLLTTRKPDGTTTVFTYPAYKLPKSPRQKPLPTPFGSIDQIKSAGTFNVQTGDCSFLETRRAGRTGINIYEAPDDIAGTFPSFQEGLKFCNRS